MRRADAQIHVHGWVGLGGLRGLQVGGWVCVIPTPSKASGGSGTGRRRHVRRLRVSVLRRRDERALLDAQYRLRAAHAAIQPSNTVHRTRQARWVPESSPLSCQPINPARPRLICHCSWLRLHFLNSYDCNPPPAPPRRHSQAGCRRAWTRPSCCRCCCWQTSTR